MGTEILERFEAFVKQYKSLFFNKLDEKYNEGYKVIYNLQGFNYKDTFFANLKFIFWLNHDKTKVEHNVVTYLYSQKAYGYESAVIDEERFEEMMERILEKIKEETTNHEINSFIIGGTDEFNEEIKRNGIDDFIMNMEYIPSGDTPSILISFKFELSTNNKRFEFDLKYDNGWKIFYDGQSYKTDMKSIYKDIIKLLYAEEKN